MGTVQLYKSIDAAALIMQLKIKAINKLKLAADEPEGNKMKTILLIFAAIIMSTCAVKAESDDDSCDDDDSLQICAPMNNFDAEFPSIVDHILPDSEPFFFRTATNFFQNVMMFNTTEIQQVTDDAITFFRDKFGVDFSNADPDANGTRHLDSINATFIPYELNPDLGYSITFNRWTVDRTRRSYCSDNRDGGFIVIFGSDTILHGTYGGVTGLPIKANERVLYGFYNIPLCSNQSPMIIQFQSASPVRIDTVDGFATINCDLSSRELGPGIAQGVFRVIPLGDGNIQYTIRNLFTFPPHPGLRSSTPGPTDDDDDK